MQYQINALPTQVCQTKSNGLFTQLHSLLRSHHSTPLMVVVIKERILILFFIYFITCLLLVTFQIFFRSRYYPLSFTYQHVPALY